MKLSDLSKLFFFLIIFLNFSKLFAENEVDIWKKNSTNDSIEETEKQEKKIPSPLLNKNTISTNNIIQEENSTEVSNALLYGIWDPDKYNFELSMWSNTDKNIQKTIARINKWNFRNCRKYITEYIIFYYYAPQNLTEKEFLDIKINWLIKNKKDDLIGVLIKNNDPIRQIINISSIEIFLMQISKLDAKK